MLSAAYSSSALTAFPFNLIRGFFKMYYNMLGF